MEFKLYRDPYKPPRFAELELDIMTENDPIAMINKLKVIDFDYLSEKKLELLAWNDIIKKLDSILLNATFLFVTLPEEDDMEKIPREKEIVMGICQFFEQLFKNVCDKQYFVSYKSLAEISTSWDLDVAEAAIKASYSMCTPAPFSVNYEQDAMELRDSLELPLDIATKCFSIFEGLGFLSPDYGLSDYIKSRYIPPYSLLDDHICFTVTSTKNSQKPVLSNVLISLSNELEPAVFHSNDEHQGKAWIDNLRSYRKKHGTEDVNHFINFINVSRAATVFKGSLSNRLRLVALRLRCFYIIIHAQSSCEYAASYLQSGCVFLKDLMSFADLSCEVSSDIKQMNGDIHEISALSTECLHRMIVLIARRRGALLQSSGLLSDIGLRQPPVRSGMNRRDFESNGSMSQEVSWITIVSSACNLAIQLIQTQTDMNNRGFSRKENEFYNSWMMSSDYITSSLELFKVSFVSSDTQSVTPITPLMTSLCNIVKFVLPLLSDSLNSETDSKLHLAMSSLTTKVVSCIDHIVDKASSRSQPSPVSILQDSDFLATIDQLFQTIDGCPNFAHYSVGLSPLLRQIFTFLSHFYRTNRRRMVNASEAGVHLVRQTSFVNIATKVFELPLSGQEVLWSDLFLLLKEAVDLEPPLHNEVINSPYIHGVLRRLQATEESNAKIHVYEFLFSLARLLRVVCVSKDGMEFISKFKLLQFIVSNTLSSATVMPASNGITATNLSSIVKILVSIMRESEKFRSEVYNQLDYILKSVAHDASICDHNDGLNESSAIHSPRMQILQRLVNICAFEENLNTETRALSSSRGIFSESSVTSLLSAFKCTLPPTRQLFAQLGNRQLHQPSHFGHTLSAKGISTLLKSAASQNPTVLLPILMKAIGETLTNISAIKKSILSESAKPIGLLDDISETISELRKLHSRKMNEETDVFIMGILDEFPNKCAFDSTLFDAGSQTRELGLLIWKFLTSVLYLEWLTLILSYALRPNTAYYEDSINQEVLRRLFGFHKSSLMEVSRFAASRSKQKDIADVRKNLHTDSFTDMDSSEDEIPIPRIPGSYYLRVISAVGTLIREDCEIDGSRIILLADNGTNLTAYERNITKNGVVRYRTSHGWMSEYRKDHQSEILELIDVGHDSLLSISKIDANETVDGKARRRLKEMMTLRESACFCLTRINTTLRVVAMHLSQSVIQYQSRPLRGRPNAGMLSATANLASGSLSKIIKGLFFYPFSSISDDQLPKCAALFGLSVQQYYQQNEGNQITRKDSKKGLNKLSRKSYSDSIDTESEVEKLSDKNAKLDATTVCLYLEAVCKYLVLPTLECKNSNLNTHLLQSLQACKGLECILDGLLFVMSTFYDSIHEKTMITTSSHAALRALPQILSVVRKLTTPNAIIQSQITETMIADYKRDEELYTLVHYVYSTVAEKISPVVRGLYIAEFPPDIQHDWYGLLFDLRKNLSENLPSPKKESYSKSEPSKWNKREDSSLSAGTPSIFSGGTSDDQHSGTGLYEFMNSRTLRRGLGMASNNDSAFTAAAQVCEAMGYDSNDVRRAYESTGSSNIANLLDFMNNNNTTPAVNPADLEMLRSLNPDLSEDDLLTAASDPELLAALRMSMNDDTSGEDLGPSTLLSNIEGVQFVTEVSSLGPTTEIMSLDVENTPFQVLPPPRELRNYLPDSPVGNILPPSPPHLATRKALESPQKGLKDTSSTGKSVDDFAVKCQDFKRLLNGNLSLEIIENSFFESCRHAHDSALSDFKDIVRFISDLFALGSQHMAQNLRNLFYKFIGDLKTSVNMENAWKSTELHGILNMILCVLQSGNSKLSVQLSRNDASNLLEYITKLIDSRLEKPVGDWELWISTGLVICYHLMSSIDSAANKNDLNLVAPIESVDTNDKAECKVEDKLIEEKSNEDILISSHATYHNSKIASWLSNHIRSLDLLPRSVWNNVSDIIHKIILSMVKCDIDDIKIRKEMKFGLREIHQYAMLVLSLLMTDEDIRNMYIDKDIISLLLQIPKAFAGKENFSLLSVVVRKLISSGEEVRDEMKQSITALFSENESKSYLSIGEFMGKLRSNPQIKSHPKESTEAVLDNCEFYQIPQSDSKSTDRVAVRMKTDLDKKSIGKSESQSNNEFAQYRILFELIGHCCKYVDMESSTSIYSSPDIIQVIGDILLSSKNDRLTTCLAKLFAMDVSKILNPDGLRSILASGSGKMKSKSNYIDFLINHYFSIKSDTRLVFDENDSSIDKLEAYKMTGYTSSRRLIVILASRRGILRRISLNGLVRNIKNYSRPSLDENTRLKVVTRLCNFIPLIFKSIKSEDDGNSSTSLDIMLHLISAGISDTLTEALAFIPLRHPKSSDAVNAILEPLEILSRPQFQNFIRDHLKKKNILTSVVVHDGQSIRVDEDGESIDGVAETNISRRGSNQSQNVDISSTIASLNLYEGRSQGGEMDRINHFIGAMVEALSLEANNIFDNNNEEDQDDSDDSRYEDENNDHNHDEQDDDDDDDDEESDEEDVIMVENVHEDDEDEHDDEEDDEDVENEDEEEDEENAEQYEEFGPDLTLHIADSGRPDRHSNPFRNIFLRSDDGLTTGLVVDGETGRNIFITPPDRIRSDPLHALISELQEERLADSPEEMIRRLIRDSAAEFPPLGRVADVQMDEARDSMSQILPPRPGSAFPRYTYMDPFLLSPDQQAARILSNQPEYRSQSTNQVFRHPRGAISTNPGREMASTGTDGVPSWIASMSYDIHHRHHDSTSLNYFNRREDRDAGDRDNNAESRQTGSTDNTASQASVNQSTIVADTFVAGLTSAINSIISQLQRETIQSPILSPVETEVVAIPMDELVNPSAPIIEAVTLPTEILTEDSSRQNQSPFHPSEDGLNEAPDSGDSVSSVSELNRNVGDMHTVASVTESSIAGSYATEIRSFQETVNESIITASIFTSDAIRGHIDNDNVSMMSSIPTTESEGDDSESVAADNVDTNTNGGHSVSDSINDLVEENSNDLLSSESAMIIADVREVVSPIESLNHDDNINIANDIDPVANADIQNMETAIANEIAPVPESNEGPAVPVQALVCPTGYDIDVFNSLPEAMQLEIIEQHSQTNNSTRELIEAAGYDYEMFSSLPESIRQEILDQARRDHPEISSGNGGSAAPAQEDNASFLLSLTPDLRAEILLTADSAFLESLPLNLQLEAQQHRDQAARRIQEREITRGGRNTRNTIIDHGGDEDNGDEYDPADNRAIFQTLGQARNRQVPTIQYDGYFRIQNDDIDTLNLPLRLLAVVTKVLCSTSVKINFTLLQQLLFNLSKHPFTRDVCLRLLISLLSNDVKMFKEALHKLDISTSASDAVFNLLLKSSDIYLLTNSRGCALRKIGNTTSDNLLVKTPSHSKMISSNSGSSGLEEMLLFSGDDDVVGAASSTTWTIPRHTLQSLILLLGQLFTNSNTAIYDVLRPRKGHGDDILNIVEESESEATSDPATADKALATKVARSCELFTEASTNSLLESLIGLLSVEDLTRNAADLLSLSTLLCKITAPLDNALKSQQKSEEERIKLMKDRIEQDKSKGMIPVKIPDIIVGSEALTSLCDVLLSDACSRKVFSDITMVISRLTIHPKNREVLLSLLVNVAEDLTEQSTKKLQSLSSILFQLYKQHNSNLKHVGEAVTSPRLLSPLPATAHSSLSSIPTYEFGGRQHDHLLRTVQTLVAISSKNQNDLNEIVPMASMNFLWNSLDEVLNQLRPYIGKEDTDEENTEISKISSTNRASSATSSAAAAAVSRSLTIGASNTPATASLIFILTKLLPAIQSLFLIFTHELLFYDDEDDKKSESASSPERPSSAATTNQPTAQTTESSAVTSQPATNEISDIKTSLNIIIPHSQVLGGRHRKGKAYRRMNISLYNDQSLGINSLEDNINRTKSFQRGLSSISATMSHLSTKSQRLQSFVATHKNLLNLLIKSQNGLLEKSFRAMIRITQLRPYLSFENKRKFFLQQLQMARRASSYGTIHLRLRRESVFEDSYEQLRSRSGEDWQGRFHIDFHGEQGIDAGGLTREFYNVLSREIFNPNYALFDAAADGATFQPNPYSNVNSNHLSYFKFVGNIIGKAICDGQLMDAHFTRSFYKHVLGVAVDYSDIEATEPEYYKTLKQILDNPLDLLMVDLTFTAETHIFGKTEIVDLIPNGRNIPVTDDNKFDYVRLIAHHRMTAAIKGQIESFLDGFYELVPAELICIFSPAELELLICGLPDIDIDNLRNNTDYHGFRPSDEIITWFWEALSSFSRAEKASFVQFVTGTSKVPLGGFGNLQGMRGVQRCSIHKAYGDHNQLPTAHTCFNQLDLPIYNSAEELREKLLLAVKEGSEGFGFA